MVATRFALENSKFAISIVSLEEALDEELDESELIVIVLVFERWWEI